MEMIRIGIVGAGKIARDQHLPALLADGRFAIAGTADPHATMTGIPGHASLAAMLAATPGLDAVAICTPPQQRFALARTALASGKHVLLEKPPCATLAEVDLLRALAGAAGCTLFATWHARHAAAVPRAASWVAERGVASVSIAWKEDVRHWHPGQAWIWQPGGFGVFDPGINALSIATAILPPIVLRSATLSVPANAHAPIAAVLHGRLEGGASIEAEFDFRQAGAPRWEMRIEATDGESLVLSRGGGALSLQGRDVPLPAQSEYAAIYDRFAGLIAAARSDVDTRPLSLVADAFMLGRRHVVEPFEDG